MIYEWVNRQIYMYIQIPRTYLKQIEIFLKFPQVKLDIT